MGFLENKRALIVGVASNRSIAYGVAKAMHREGAELAFTYQGDKLRDRVAGFAAEFGSDIVLPLDVSSDDEIDAVFSALGDKWDGLDCLIHSVGFAPRDQLDGTYADSVNREGFRIAHDISAYSLAALAKAGRSMMQGRNGSIVTMSYLGAVRTIPHYNVMGVAKAALEASVRYLADSLGPEGTRVNAVSAGPIKTLAASGIGDFRYILKWNEYNAPMRRTVTIEEVGESAVYLLSPMSRGVTGEILHVDAGYHVVGMKNPTAPDITKE